MREDIPAAIASLEETNTWVRILSGDHKLAVSNAADKLEMNRDDSENDIISGEELISRILPLMVENEDVAEGRGTSYLFKDQASKTAFKSIRENI